MNIGSKEADKLDFGELKNVIPDYTLDINNLLMNTNE